MRVDVENKEPCDDEAMELYLYIHLAWNTYQYPSLTKIAYTRFFFFFHFSLFFFATVRNSPIHRSLRRVAGFPEESTANRSGSSIAAGSRGVLLYGPPGCGKTMLSHAVPKTFGLRAVAVSGPELLSKFSDPARWGGRPFLSASRQNPPGTFPHLARFLANRPLRARPQV